MENILYRLEFHWLYLPLTQKDGIHFHKRTDLVMAPEIINPSNEHIT